MHIVYSLNKCQNRVMISIAEFERAMILEWQRERIAIAKSEGKYKGRKAVSVQTVSITVNI